VAESEEPITSPDQRKPTNTKLFYTAMILGSLGLLTMIFGNHRGNIENLWLIGLAAAGFLTVAVDWTLRRNGLR